MRDNYLAQALHQQFLDCKQYAKLLSRTAKASGTEVHITGLLDSAKSLVCSLLLHEVKRPIFLITADHHHATRYLEEIGNLSRYRTFLYPVSEVSPYEQVLHSPDTIAGQMEVIEHILSQPTDPYFVIMPARALMQRVLDAHTFKNNTLTIRRGQELSLEQVRQSLVRLGYNKESIVTLRGEFSTRGDIIDVYPAFGQPVRIELFGDEVESIRTFSVETQRSVGEEDIVHLPPRWWVVLDDAASAYERINQAMNESIKELDEQGQETLRLTIEGDLETLQAGSYPESLEYYHAFLNESFATIMHYLPENALVLYDEWDTVMMSLKSWEKKLEETYEEGFTSGRLLKLPRPLHMKIAEVAAESQRVQRGFLTQMAGIEFGENAAGGSDSGAMIEFQCHNVERFANQIKELVSRIKQWIQAGMRVIISTEQPQRVLGLLREWDCQAVYLTSARDAGTLPASLKMESDGPAPSGLLEALESERYHDVKVWVTRHGFVGSFRLDDIQLVSVTDAEMFGVKRKPIVYRRPVTERNYDRFTSVSELKVGDYVVHIKHGIGQFIGVQRIAYDKQVREYLAVQYTGDDRLYVPVDQINLLSRYRGAGENAPRLSRLGGADWESTKKRVKKSVRMVAEELVNLYAMRAKQQGFQCIPDTPWQLEMEEAFPYEETPDQWQAIVEVKDDMESIKPMDRLICGDVGFGKTEVAIRAIFKAVMSGRQAAVLVPTTVLAQQHFNNLSERFAPYPVRVGLLSRFRTAREQKEVINRLSTGECDVVVATHRLLQKDIIFKDLGIVVIDEEHRFGVAHKEKLKQLRVMVDVLTMSATPIPRTLNMALTKVRDMSVINTPPTNRAPVKTYVGEYRPQVVRTAVLHELERNGQIYFVHNRVETIEQIALELMELVPGARIAVGHGQMQERDLENVMLAFSNHEFDILVCTTIIESGLDIPNANTIIIDQADRLGLAQLYQLRGRVGRSDVQAYAYCFYRPEKVLSETAQNRLKAIREFTSLGSGYQIALRDMEIRGVGNILGPEQHGHMVAVGFDLYCKLLGETVAELQGQQVAPDADTQIDINITAFIPEGYIPDPEHRIIEYKRLADVKSERELVILTDEWRDRFGSIPAEVKNLVQIVKLRLIASRAGVMAVKPDIVGCRLLVNYRLQQWLPIQSKLPTHLASRTTYKPGSPGVSGPSPYVLVKSDGLEPIEQLNLLEELLNAMNSYQPVRTN